MDNSKIEWCDHTFNPWEGCQKVAPECDNCYAEARDHRFTGGAHWGPKAPRRRTSAANWHKPHKWNRDHAAFHAAHGRRQRVFCASLADVFDNAVDPQWRADLFDLIRATPNLDWLLLTKRPQNMVKMLPEDWGDGWPHVWLGTSAGTQKTADQNIPHLLDTPAAVRFVSAEPLLGAVDMRNLRSERGTIRPYLANVDALDGSCQSLDNDSDDWFRLPSRLDWVIVGGESGPNARPMHPDWARSLRDQCQAAGVAFFFKQWGEWLPFGQCIDGHQRAAVSRTTIESNRTGNGAQTYFGKTHWRHPDGYLVTGTTPGVRPEQINRVGKKIAGRLLDGREWNEGPSHA